MQPSLTGFLDQVSANRPGRVHIVEFAVDQHHGRGAVDKITICRARAAAP